LWYGKQLAPHTQEEEAGFFERKENRPGDPESAFLRRRTGNNPLRSSGPPELSASLTGRIDWPVRPTGPPAGNSTHFRDVRFIDLLSLFRNEIVLLFSVKLETGT
jgi:hypothetical protein